jgi:DNA topoisomerase IA
VASVLQRALQESGIDPFLEDLAEKAAQPAVRRRRPLLICRSYLAAVMPDYEYRQTAVTLCVPSPPGDDAEFRAVGRIPLVQGWKAVYSVNEPDAAPGNRLEALLVCKIEHLEHEQMIERRPASLGAKRKLAPEFPKPEREG